MSIYGGHDQTPLLYDIEGGDHLPFAYEKPRASSWPRLRFPTVRRAVLLLILAIVFLAGFATHPSTPSLPASMTLSSWRASASDPDVKSRLDKAVRVKVLRELLRERYPAEGHMHRRGHNLAALDRLAECMQAGTCGPNEGKIALLASYHFGSSTTGGNGGEDIWALSIIKSLHALNYTTLWTWGHMDTLFIYQSLPEMIPVVIWEGAQLQRCIERNDQNYRELEKLDDSTPGDWQRGQHACMQSANYPQGIPWWKSFGFHFWSNSITPLGAQWTLAPEDYNLTSNNQDPNQYLGYSIEDRCMSQPYFTNREHRGLILSKNIENFNEDQSLFFGMLDGIRKEMPMTQDRWGGDIPFELLSTAGDELNGGDELHSLPEPGIKSIGRKPQEQWTQTLARGKLLLGIGNPLLSPSPYDALCMGVPFIQPIRSWDESNPHDRRQWETQMDALKYVEEPYVYHVFKGDKEGLARAIRKAISTPIERYIPPQMTKDAVIDRHRFLMTHDWLAEAKSLVADKFNSAPEYEYLTLPEYTGTSG